MADKLYNYFKTAGDIGGVKARTQLSMLTRITSMQSLSLADSVENINMFEEAIAKIKNDFQSGGIIDYPAISLPRMPASNEKKVIDILRKQIAIFTDLTAQRHIYQGDLSTTFNRITESIIEAIDVERASIWFYDDKKTKIVCEDLFIRSTGEHSKGVELSANDFPLYFTSIETERTLAADDAHNDMRTMEFSQIYLKPLGINSMLDVPIWVNNQMVGVLCHEHVGPKRTWTVDEENFAYLMGNIVAMAMER